jgi:two-component system sensor histidine kinase KdpD
MSTQTHTPEAVDFAVVAGASPEALNPEKEYFSVESSPSRERMVLEFFAAFAGFVVITLLAFGLHATLSATAFLYFLIIVLAALRWGFWQATTFSVGAVLCLDYFFTSPLFSLRVNRAGDWTALIAFEFAGLVVSRLSAQAQHHARVASQERNNIQRLYELARSILLLDSHEPAGKQISAFVQRAIDVDSVALFDFSTGQVYGAGEQSPELEVLVRSTWVEDRNQNDPVLGALSRVMRLGRRGTGAIALRAKYLNPLVADAVASIAAVALERSRSLEKEARAEAARQSEQLRAAVLDALAHAFKTPLTVIRTVSSGLLEAGALNPQETELVSLIDEETVRLTELATRLLQTARLEGTAASATTGECDPAQVVEHVLKSFEAQLDGRPVKVSVPGVSLSGVSLPNQRLIISANPDLVATALSQFIDNAIKYSLPGTPISVSVTTGAAEAVFSVHNVGPSIQPEDRERIFERFYRSPGTEYRAAGTGLGLSITRKVAEAHRGRAWVVSSEASGTTFFFTLPLHKEDTHARSSA